mgnify:CR=1 FL=1
MRKRSYIHVSSLIVILSILTIIIEFTTYYLFPSIYPILGISGVLLIICSHILLQQSSTYETIFIYTLSNMFISSLIMILTYYSAGQSSFIQYSPTIHIIIGINWLVPTLHCFLRYMFSYSFRISNYRSYYVKNSILFTLCYLGVLIYGNFVEEAFPSLYRAVLWSDSINITPFITLSMEIEDYLYGIIPLSYIFIYLASRILIFIPYGYYITLLTKKCSRPIRILLYLFLPGLIELIQFFIYPSRSDIDDLIYGFIGAIIGSLFFNLVGIIFRSISGKDYLEKEGYYSSFNSLHF